MRGTCKHDDNTQNAISFSRRRQSVLEERGEMAHHRAESNFWATRGHRNNDIDWIGILCVLNNGVLVETAMLHEYTLRIFHHLKCACHNIVIFILSKF